MNIYDGRKYWLLQGLFDYGILQIGTKIISAS